MRQPLKWGLGQSPEVFPSEALIATLRRCGERSLDDDGRGYRLGDFTAVGNDRSTRNAVHNIHAGDNLAERGIVAVKEGAVRVADEELAGSGVVAA